ncbi:DUF411 domain-containing protein [Marinobacteraceae bacterium S3BR75-40.1]
MLKKLTLAAITATFSLGAFAQSPITVYKTPWCGCCEGWITHLRENGFEPEVHDTQTINSIKEKVGLTRNLASCHTAFIGDYVIEGHVPARDIQRLLEEKPEAKGLAVPGMPMGSPGMEGPRSDRYAVLLFNEAGQTRVFATYD